MKMPINLRKQVRPAVVAVLALASAGAIAGDKPALQAKDGLLVLSNVSIVNAPVSDDAVASPSSGMRAQKDKDTGRLRAPTGEEVVAMEAEAGIAAPAEEESVTLTRLPSGTIAARLTAEHMSYSVIRKSADGKLVSDCVAGETAAQHALHANVAEVANDR